MKRLLLPTFILPLSLSSCSLWCDDVAPAATSSQATIKVVQGNDIRGTVRREWAEPMPDTVQVPGQIDPTNTYYRSQHKTVVENRPGKYSEVTYDGEKK